MGLDPRKKSTHLQIDNKITTSDPTKAMARINMSALGVLVTRAAKLSVARGQPALAKRTATALAVNALSGGSSWPSVQLNGNVSVRNFSKAAKKGKAGKPEKQKTSRPTEPSVTSGGGDAEENVAALVDKTKKNMHGAVVQFTRALSQMRPGKADAGMFDDLHVQAYGAHVALSQVAQVAVVSSHAVSVNVYDPSLLKDIKKVVEAMNPVFSVREDVNALHISFPKMSKETRDELIKAAKKQAEQSRQHVRRVRQDAMNGAKKLKEHMPEDDVKKYQDDIQKVTDDAIAEIGKLLAQKEKDMVEV